MTDDNRTATDTETPRKDSDGEAATVVYRGSANAFQHGEYIFRPGQPVTVPSEVAEDLLTYPNEKFEEAKENS